MKNTLRLLTLLLLGISVVFFIGCEDDDDDDVSPLVGTWTMSNMAQSSVYTAATAIAALGFAEGDTVASGGMVWAEFSALGVDAEVVVKEDGTFTLVGHLPSANDTLGVAPAIIPLTDSGEAVVHPSGCNFKNAGELLERSKYKMRLPFEDPSIPLKERQPLTRKPRVKRKLPSNNQLGPFIG